MSNGGEDDVVYRVNMPKYLADIGLSFTTVRFVTPKVKSLPRMISKVKMPQLLK